jgi:hypothetical protein
MPDYKKQSKKRKELFESLANDYRHMREWIPCCCGKPIQLPHRAACTTKEFCWLCGECGKYYRIKIEEVKFKGNYEVE